MCSPLHRCAAACACSPLYRQRYPWARLDMDLSTTLNMLAFSQKFGGLGVWFCTRAHHLLKRDLERPDRLRRQLARFARFAHCATARTPSHLHTRTEVHVARCDSNDNKLFKQPNKQIRSRPNVKHPVPYYTWLHRVHPSLVTHAGAPHANLAVLRSRIVSEGARAFANPTPVSSPTLVCPMSIWTIWTTRADLAFCNS
jgi:hypothetical protein